MAYIPKDTSGRNYAVENGMSEEDQKAIADLQKAWSQATDKATRSSLHSAAEAIRAKYGYSGGSDGTQNLALPKQQTPDPVDAYIERLENLYSGQDNAYAQALAAQQEANRKAVAGAVSSLNNQKNNTETSYADLFRQLYLNKMSTKKNIGQQMAALGQTGGAMESTLQGIDTSYDEALRSGHQSKQQALNELEEAIIQAELNGDITNAEAAANSAINRAASYADVLKTLIDRADAAAARDASAAATLSANNRSYAYQTAMQILQGGNMASDELLDAAGISRADAQSIVNQALANAAAKASSGSSKSGSSKMPSANDALDGLSFEERVSRLFEDAYKSGTPSSYISNHWKEYGLSSSSGLTSDYKTWLEGRDQASGSESGQENEYASVLEALTAGDSDYGLTGSSLSTDRDSYADLQKFRALQEGVSTYQEIASGVQELYETEGAVVATAFLKDALNAGFINQQQYGVLHSKYRQ